MFAPIVYQRMLAMWATLIRDFNQNHDIILCISVVYMTIAGSDFKRFL